MNINLHIERLILEGIPLTFGDRVLLQAAVEKELTHLFENGGISSELQSCGALDCVKKVGIQLSEDGNAIRLGEQIAAAVYGGIGK